MGRISPVPKLLLVLFILSIGSAFAWTPELNMTFENPGAGSPTIAVGPTGRIHVVYAHQPPGQGLRLFYTCWTGTGWTSPQDLPGPNYKEPLCSIAVDSNDHVHVAGIYRPASDDPNITRPYTVFYWEYDGSSWTGPTQLSSGEGQDPYDNAGSPRIAVDKNNDVHVVWAHDNMVGGESDILYRRRIGGIWSSTQNVTANYAGTSYGSCSPDLAVDRNGSNVHVVWHDDFLNNGFQVYYTKNTNLGDPAAWLPRSQWTQLSSGDYGKGPHMVLDRNDYPNIWWTDQFGGSTNKQAYTRWTGANWISTQNWGEKWFQGAAFDSSNLMHYLYTGPDAGGTIELFYRTFNFSTLSAAQQVSLGVNTLKVDYASLALDPSGTPHALWIERKGAWPGLGYIFYSKNTYSPPPGPVTGLKVDMVSSSSLKLSWTNPTSSNYLGTIIRYRFDAYPLDQYDGNLLADLRSTPGSAATFTHAGLPSGQTVFYTLFTYNSDSVFSAGVNGSSRTDSVYDDLGSAGNGTRLFALAATRSGDAVYTGTDGTSTLRGSFKRFTPSNRQWTDLTSLCGCTGRVLSLIVHSNGKVYGIQSGSGNSNEQGNGRTLWSFNPVNNAYQALYTGPTGTDLRGELTEDFQGRLWFGDNLGNLMAYDPKVGGSPAVYSRPSDYPGGIILGIEPMPNGVLYYVIGSYSSGGDVQFGLYKLDTKSGQRTRLAIPSSVGNEWICTPLITGNDGYIYGPTQRATGRIIRINPATDQVVDLGTQFPDVWGSDSKRIDGAAWAPTGKMYWGSSRDASNNAHMFNFDRSIPAGTINGSRDNGELHSSTYNCTSAIYSGQCVYFGAKMDSGTPHLFTFKVAGAEPSPTLSSLRNTGDGTRVTLNCKTVTGAFGDHFYIEDPDRIGGIKVLSGAPVGVGSMVSVTGALQVVEGERQIASETVSIYSGGNGVPEPWCWNVKTIGGGQCGNIPGLFDSFGLNNVGLLGRVTGRVVGIGREGSCFYVDDGSGTPSFEGFAGVKVISNRAVSIGQKVIVTGISSVAMDEESRALRQLKTRTSEDVRILP